MDLKKFITLTNEEQRCFQEFNRQIRLLFNNKEKSLDKKELKYKRLQETLSKKHGYVIFCRIEKITKLINNIDPYIFVNKLLSQYINSYERNKFYYWEDAKQILHTTIYKKKKGIMWHWLIYNGSRRTFFANLRIALIAHRRHTKTNYNDLLRSGVKREKARQLMTAIC